jgi:hypothetical protein
VRTAGTPVGTAPLRPFWTVARAIAWREWRLLLELKILAFRFARFPQLASRKPPHHDVGVLALQLRERRLQFLALARTEGRRLVVD